MKTVFDLLFIESTHQTRRSLIFVTTTIIIIIIVVVVVVSVLNGQEKEKKIREGWKQTFVENVAPDVVAKGFKELRRTLRDLIVRYDVVVSECWKEKSCGKDETNGLCHVPDRRQQRRDILHAMSRVVSQSASHCSVSLHPSVMDQHARSRETEIEIEIERD